MSDYVELSPGTWLAKSIVNDYFADPKKYPQYSGKPIVRERYKATELTIDTAADSLFTLAFPAATFIEDASVLASHDKGTPIVNYSIPTAPENLDAIVVAATEARTQAGGAHAANRSLSKWIILLNAAGFAVLGAYFIWRRSRPTANTNSQE